MSDLTKQKMAFGRSIAERIREKGCFEGVQFDASDNKIKIMKDGSVDRSLNLESFFSEVQGFSDDEREQFIEERIHSLLIEPAPELTDMTFAQALPNLKPMLRPRVEFENSRLRLIIEMLREKKDENYAAETSSPYLELGDYFGVGLAYDLPDKRFEVAAFVLDHWGVKLEEAINQAQVNLEPAEGEPFGEIQPGLWVSVCEDTYDSTRIMIPDLVRCYPVNGDPLALIVSRDVVFITGSEDVKNICELPGLADVAFDTHVKTFRERPIVLTENGLWEYWYDPDLDLPVAVNQWFSDNETAASSSDYGEQTELLREIFLLEGKSVIVPDIGILESDEQKLTICKWEADKTTCLPYCQLIAIPYSKGEYALASIVELLEAYPDHFEETEYFPARLNVERCLSDRELKLFLTRYPNTPVVELEF